MSGFQGWLSAWRCGLVLVGGLLSLAGASAHAAGADCTFRELPRTADGHGRFTVLVGALAGDDGGERTRRVADALAAEPGFGRLGLCRDPAVQARNGGRTRDTAETTGGGWLARYRGDVLVWGEVPADGGDLSLHLLGRERNLPARLAAQVLLDLKIPQGFAASDGSLLSVAALSAIAVSEGERRTGLAAHLRSALARFEEVCNPTPVGILSPRMRTSLLFLGHGFRRLMEIRPSEDAEKHAWGAYHSALRAQPQEWSQREWGAALIGMAAVTRMEAQRKKDPAAMRASINLYFKAQEVFTRERSPLDWADLYGEIGSNLIALAEMADEENALVAAVEAYTRALRVWIEKRSSREEAAGFDGLGRVYLSLGKRRNDPELIEGAVSAFREALRQRSQGGGDVQVHLDEALALLPAVRESQARGTAPGPRKGSRPP